MNEIDRSVGTRIRSLRKAPGLSQSETDEGTGLTFRQAQMCGNGANRIAQSRLWTIADGLRLSGGHGFRIWARRGLIRVKPPDRWIAPIGFPNTIERTW